MVSLFTCAVTLSSVGAAAAVDEGPAGAAGNPYGGASVVIGGAGQAFGILGGVLGKAGGSAFGLSALAAILGPLLGFGGPSIQDVLDKLDQMSEQLDQIQEQLQEISAQISQLQMQIANLSKQVANNACANRQEDLSPYLTTIEGVRDRFNSMLDTAKTLPTSPDPQATLATIQEDFNAVATEALGSNSNTPAGGPLDTAIRGIHEHLMGQENVSDGLIETCAEAGLLNAKSANIGFADDRPYYAYVTALVNYYENYEVLGLSLQEEATYYRVTQSLRDQHFTIGVDQGRKLCALDEVTSGLAANAAQLCRDSQKLITTDYGYLVGEWALTGRPYSDANVVLQVPTTESGRTSSNGTPVKPVLWVRDPTAVPAAMRTGTWESSGATGTYDDFSGWRPGTNADWQNFQLGATVSDACGNPQGDRDRYNLFCAMDRTVQPDGSKAFTYPNDSLYWIPKESAGGLTLPIDRLAVVYGYLDVYNYYYDGPDLALRCFVQANPQLPSPIGCDQVALNRMTNTTFWTNGNTESVNTGRYTMTWCFDRAIFPGSGTADCPFVYDYVGPYGADSQYNNSKSLYRARIDQPVVGRYPPFLQGISYDTTSGKPVTYSPPEVKEGLWQAQDVPTEDTKTQGCINTVGIPKLCVPLSGKPTPADQPFEAFINNTIPNPSVVSPAAKAAPTMTGQGTSAQCLSGGWKAPPTRTWTYGGTKSLPTTWTGTSGDSSYTAAAGAGTPVLADNQLDLHAFATAATFDPTKPFLLTCTVSARWEHLINTGSALSATYQVSPTGSTYVVSQVPDAPAIGPTVAGDKSATVHWTVGASNGTPITSFTIVPYVKGVAQPPLTRAADDGPGLSPAQGSKDSTTIDGLTPGVAFRFSVIETGIAPGSTTEVPSPASSTSEPVTPEDVAPLAPISKSTTTTTRPLTPVTTTTTTAPSGDAFTQTLTRTDSSTATAIFTPEAPQKSVDLHYQVGSDPQQNVRMTEQSNGSYIELIRGLSAGDRVTYWFTYVPVSTGLAVDSDNFRFTMPKG